MGSMNRVVVVGISGSGKTTLARQIADVLEAPHLEMDSAFHKYGLADTAPPDFRPALEEVAQADRWVIDGNYSSHGARDVVWPRADTIVWLDLPRRTAMARVVGRTLRRVLTREEMWEGAKEPFTNLYRFDPLQNIMVWTWTQHAEVRDKYESVMSDGTWDHAAVHRLRSRSEVEAFLASLAG
jgi:adenylate kinase family enzyme